jgi:hypothetical protein
MSFKQTVLKNQKNGSHPYVLTIENTTDEVQDWFLFGSNLHLHSDNFGNKLGVNVTSKNIMPYHAILTDFISNSIKVNLLRFYTDNKQNFESNLIIRHVKFNATVQRCEKLKEHYNQNQLQDSVIDVKISFTIDKNTHLSGTIQPNTKIVLDVFPVEVIKV